MFVQVVLVVGQTGSGKTTQVPHWLLDELQKAGARGSVVVTQPRRVTATSVAARVAEEMGEVCGARGALTGYQVRLDSKRSGSTRLLFCTAGVLLRRLQSDPVLASVACVVLDEVHERTLEADFLLILCKTVLLMRHKTHPGLPPLRLVLMSATLDQQALQGFFGGPHTCPTLHVQGRTYPVAVYFLDELLTLSGYAGAKDALRETKADGKHAPADKAHDKAAASNGGGATGAGLDHDLLEHLLLWLHAQREKAKAKRGGGGLGVYSDAHAPGPGSSAGNPNKVADGGGSGLDEEGFGETGGRGAVGEADGSVLVFLPGLSDIRKQLERLREHPVLGDERQYCLLPLHSSLPAHAMRAVFARARPGVRKIVLSTNIAETGVTLPDVVYVIDSGRMKESRYDSKRHVNSLRECFVSRANAEQRRGRAGRVRPG